MNRTLHPLDVMIGAHYFRPVFIKVEYSGNRLSIAGVVGPMKSGNAYGGCGQINMFFDEYYPENERRYTDGWSKDLFDYLLAIWDQYHLNDLQAACEHQRLLGWTYKEYPSKACPICGYTLGSEWKHSDIPAWVVDSLFTLPKTDKIPAWV